MKSTTRLISLIFSAAFIIFGAGNTLAGEYASKETNPKFLEEAIQHAETGIGAAEAGDAAATLNHIKASLDSLKEINSEANAARIQKASGKLRVAWAHAKKAVNVAKKGDDSKVAAHLAKVGPKAIQGIELLKKLHFNN